VQPRDQMSTNENNEAIQKRKNVTRKSYNNNSNNNNNNNDNNNNNKHLKRMTIEFT
jgi:hypothetical protein